MTPNDVEMVKATELTVGDMIFSFTPIGVSISIPPTQRQLNAKRTRWTTVNDIELCAPYGNDLVIVNGRRDGIWFSVDAYAWRVKRS